MVWPSGSYSEVTFSLRIKRLGSTITVTVIAPGLAISFMSLLFYFLPKGDGKRIPYLATIILTEIMFLVMLTTFVPLSRDLPLIEGLFLALTFVLCFMTVPVMVLEWKVKTNAMKKEKEEF